MAKRLGFKPLDWLKAHAQPSPCMQIPAWPPVGLHYASRRLIVAPPPLEQAMSEASAADDPYVKVTLDLRQSTLAWLDALQAEMGLRSRGVLVSRLLDELARPADVA